MVLPKVLQARLADLEFDPSDSPKVIFSQSELLSTIGSGNAAQLVENSFLLSVGRWAVQATVSFGPSGGASVRSATINIFNQNGDNATPIGLLAGAIPAINIQGALGTPAHGLQFPNPSLDISPNNNTMVRYISLSAPTEIFAVPSIDVGAGAPGTSTVRAYLVAKKISNTP